MTEPTINSIRLLHHPDPHMDQKWCAECGKWWPCPTIRVVDQAQP